MINPDIGLSQILSAAYDTLIHARGVHGEAAGKLSAKRKQYIAQGLFQRVAQAIFGNPLEEEIDRAELTLSRVGYQIRDAQENFKKHLSKVTGEFPLEAVIYHPQTAPPGRFFSIIYRINFEGEDFEVSQHVPKVKGLLVKDREPTITISENLPPFEDDPDSGDQRLPLIKAPSDFRFYILKSSFVLPFICNPLIPWTPTLTPRSRLIVPPLLES